MPQRWQTVLYKIDMDLAKRALFKRGTQSPLRSPLPWQINEDDFIDSCTRCSRCVDACDEKIIVIGDGGFPSINFHHGECSFCYQCAAACPETLFHTQEQRPWLQVAQFGESCLAFQRIECRTCGDSCDQQAIHFTLKIGTAASPTLRTDSCNSCGACVSVCPTQAINITLLNTTPRGLSHATQ